MSSSTSGSLDYWREQRKDLTRRNRYTDEPNSGREHGDGWNKSVDSGHNFQTTPHSSTRGSCIS